jgi:hypothetical protein
LSHSLLDRPSTPEFTPDFTPDDLHLIYIDDLHLIYTCSSVRADDTHQGDGGRVQQTDGCDGGYHLLVNNIQSITMTAATGDGLLINHVHSITVT